MYARVNRFKDDPGSIDASEQFAEREILPKLEQTPGFLGVLSLVDRTTGGSLAITFWESESAMRDSETTADRLREEIADGTGSRVETIERYEVSLRAGI